MNWEELEHIKKGTAELLLWRRVELRNKVYFVSVYEEIKVTEMDLEIIKRR